MNKIKKMNKTKEIIVGSKTEKKSGVSQYGSWTITELVDQDDLKFATFNGGLYEIGNSYPITYKEEVKDYQGRGYTNRTIQDNPSKKTPKASQKWTPPAEKAVKEMVVDDEIIARLERIEKSVEEIKKAVIGDPI